MKLFLLTILGLLFSFTTFSQGSAGTGSINFTVTDSLGNPVQNAEVVIYNAKRNWRIDSARYVAHPFITDANGQVSAPNLTTGNYWFNVRNGYRTNRFTLTDSVSVTNSAVNITVPIRDLTEKEFDMCGTCDNKTWITDSLVIFGNAQAYDADSKLLSDATWWDSNDNHGFWWFHDNETKMTYNYDTNSTNGGGSDVEATILTLNDSIFIGNMTMIGIPVTYHMSVVYDTINLAISGNDTTMHLDNTGNLNIIPYDLNLTYDYCFTCNVTLSKSNFNASNLGPNTITATLTDRCGNTTNTTITVTISAYNPTSVNEVSHANFSVYPNPVNTILTVSGTGMEYIEVYTIQGKLVQQITQSKSQYTIDVSKFNKGVYILKIGSNQGVSTQKVVVE